MPLEFGSKQKHKTLRQKRAAGMAQVVEQHYPVGIVGLPCSNPTTEYKYSEKMKSAFQETSVLSCSL
jgi:hypothetical protein